MADPVVAKIQELIGPPPVEVITAKPGFKTSEFWLTLAVIVASYVQTTQALPTDSLITKIVGGAVTILGLLGYTAARTSVKNA
jgi:hypothetical protein